MVLDQTAVRSGTGRQDACLEVRGRCEDGFCCCPDPKKRNSTVPLHGYRRRGLRTLALYRHGTCNYSHQSVYCPP